ncbi:acyl-CoA dehydrogenase [Haladaptatus sp. DYF46]|uniref:acyl-CoA dehydrogenase n=1 Tax=Haladaptatus sp. DYF46 TaxID=2886041 RepID=UPI001E2C6D43|nr:acyl-CoA dehydrogenase [Haladaptatus sp. DYF46]
MTNSFKSGSGNLDFGSNDGEANEGEDQNDTENQIDEQETSKKEETAKGTNNRHEESLEQATPIENNQSNSELATNTSSEEYPYYIRRSNIGDERDKRLELHVRDTVTNDEPTFRNRLADELDVDEVAKTDAREAALLFAFQNPEKVADLLREEGYGVFQ